MAHDVLRSARVAAALTVACALGACGGSRGEATSEGRPLTLRSASERAAQWTELASEAARRAHEACASYSVRSFRSARRGAHGTEGHGTEDHGIEDPGPCRAPVDAARHARVADLALLASVHAHRDDLRGEDQARVELEGEASAGPARLYVGRALQRLDAPFSRPSAPEGCALARRRVMAHILELSLAAKREALTVCPQDGALPLSPSAVTFVPASRCAGDAHAHTTAAHALLLAADPRDRGATAEALRWVHDSARERARGGVMSLPSYASLAPHVQTELAGIDRCELTAAFLPEGWQQGASPRRVPGTGITLRLPPTARLAPGVVELAGALDVRVSMSTEAPEAVLARAPRGITERRVHEGRTLWVHRLAGGQRLESGVALLVELGDVTAVLSVAHFLPVADGLWERVLALMSTAERADGAERWVVDDLGFRVLSPELPLVSFEPGRVHFADPTATAHGPAQRWTASLEPGGVQRHDQEGVCDPPAVFPSVRAAPRVLAHRAAPLAGAPGCEVAVILSRAGGGARFEYVAYGFLPDQRAHVRVSVEIDDRESVDALLVAAREFASGFALCDGDVADLRFGRGC